MQWQLLLLVLLLPQRLRLGCQGLPAVLVRTAVQQQQQQGQCRRCCSWLLLLAAAWTLLTRCVSRPLMLRVCCWLLLMRLV
jgi:hypothetical protein